MFDGIIWHYGLQGDDAVCRVKEIEIMGYTILIVHHNGKFYALGSRCPVGNESLADGIESMFF